MLNLFVTENEKKQGEWKEKRKNTRWNKKYNSRIRNTRW